MTLSLEGENVDCRIKEACKLFVLCTGRTSGLKVLVSWILVAGHLHCSNVAFLRAGCRIKPHLHGHVWLSVAMTTDCKDANGNHHQHRQTADDQAERQSSTETVHASVRNLLDEWLQTVTIIQINSDYARANVIKCSDTPILNWAELQHICWICPTAHNNWSILNSSSFLNYHDK